MKYFPTFNRRLVILLVSQALAGSTSAVIFLISGFVGSKIAPDLKLSTLPMSAFIIGVAFGSPLAPFVMSRIGRKAGHQAGFLTTLAGALAAAAALSFHHFAGYCLANIVCGLGMAFNNQIRFTAAEPAGDEKPLVHSWVLMCGLVAAILGPWIAVNGYQLLPYGDYTGSLALLALLLLSVLIMSLALPDEPAAPALPGTETGNLALVVENKAFWLSSAAGVSSFAVMTLLMSATPIQMHEMEHYSHHDTTWTIQSHIIAMFLPSLFSGVLLSRLGVRKLIVLGSILFIACLPIAYSHKTVHHYWWALVLLGIGWNFLFLAGSTLVSQSFSGPERFVAQGLNDVLVFGTQTVASLAAGSVLFAWGWQTLVFVPVPFLLGLLGLNLLLPRTIR